MDYTMDDIVDDQIEVDNSDVESADAASDNEGLYDEFVSCCK